MKLLDKGLLFKPFCVLGIKTEKEMKKKLVRLGLAVLSCFILCSCTRKKIVEEELGESVNFPLIEINTENVLLSSLLPFCIEISFSKEFNVFELAKEINCGWNLGDALESYYGEGGYDYNIYSETLWGNPTITKELIDFVCECGFNSIRIPITWYYNSGRDDDGNLIVGEKWLQRTQEVVDYALENDMYVIINSMHDSQTLFKVGYEDETEWNKVKSDATALWKQISDSYRDYDERLVFEGFNEIENIDRGFNYSDLASRQMNELNQIFVDTVRLSGGKNENRILLVPTLFNGTLSNVLDSYELPTDINPNLLGVSVHCYEKEFDQDIEWKFEELNDFSDRIGAPVMITEFGARDDYPLPELREEYTYNYVSRAANHGIRCFIWDDGYHWKLVDRNDFEQTNFELLKYIFTSEDEDEINDFQLNKWRFDDPEDYYFGSFSLETGELEPVDYKKKFWAMLTPTAKDGRLLNIPNCEKMCLSAKTKGKMCSFWISYLSFLDESGNVIETVGTKEIFHRFVCMKIPEGAKYFVTCLYDPYYSLTWDEIEEGILEGDFALSISFLR